VAAELDIWRAANLLIRRHGESAELEAARMQGLMLNRGDDAGRAAAVGADKASDRGTTGRASRQAELNRRARRRMKTLLAAAMFDFCALPAVAAKLSREDAVEHAGETAIVCGVVASTRT
jgi:hypothetical protein